MLEPSTRTQCWKVLYFTFTLGLQLTAVTWVITHAGIAAGVGRASCRVLFCLSVCPLSNRKTAWAINIKLGTHVLCSSCSSCIDPEVKRSRSHTVRKPSRCTVASGCSVTLCCATCGRCWRGSACRYDFHCFLVVKNFRRLIFWLGSIDIS